VLTRLRRRDTTFRLASDGRTPRRYAQTAQSGEILYVLAQTPADSLYESYVNTGERFFPGFDAVQSGRMTMGPVPPEAQRRYRAVFRLRREMRADPDANATPKMTSVPGTESASGRPESREPDARKADSQVGEPASSDSSRGLDASLVWWLFLGGVAGSLAGGGMVLSLLSGRLRRAEEARNELHNELQDLKGQQFEEAPETDPPDTAGSVEGLITVSPSPDELKELRGEVERLCEEVEQLRNENKRLREESERLRDENEQLHEENRRLQEEPRREDEDIGQQIEEIRKHLQSLQESAED
jgi:FtsZ-binding cell division protein ZapB